MQRESISLIATALDEISICFQAEVCGAVRRRRAKLILTRLSLEFDYSLISIAE